MTDIFFSGYFIVSIIILILTWLNLRRPPDLPPGPPIYVPLLGNMVGLTPENVLQKLSDYRQKYGDVFSLKMGSKWWIIINGYNTLVEAFVTEEKFSVRPDTFVKTEVAKGYGIIFTSGHLWLEQRTFAMAKLRHFVFDKSSLKNDILKEVEVLVENIKSHNGQSFDISNMLSCFSLNVICSFVFGKRLDHSDPEFVRLVHLNEESKRLVNESSILMWLPFVKYIPGDPGKRRKYHENAKDRQECLTKIIDEQKRTYVEGKTRSFIDMFIAEIRVQRNKEGNTFTENQLLRTVAEFFTGGTETTSVTIKWAILCLIRYPEVQDKLRQEIKDADGLFISQRMGHLPDLPYMEAFITEVHRLGNATPLALFHGSCHEEKFHGYRVPKDAIISPNLFSVHHDPNEFPEPHKFNPSRFLDKEGKYCGNEKVIGLSVGRRRCVGEALVKMEMFLVLSGLIRKFKFQPEEGQPLPSEDAAVNPLRAPRQFRLCAVELN